MSTESIDLWKQINELRELNAKLAKALAYEMEANSILSYKLLDREEQIEKLKTNT